MQTDTENTLKVFSPTQTEAHIFCPVARRLEHVEGWQTRRLGKTDIARALGSAFAAGVACWWNNKRINFTGDPYSVAQVHFHDRLKGWTAGGRVIPEWEEANIGGADKKLAKALDLATKQNPIPSDWVPLHVEPDLGPRAGYGRPDLGMDTPHGPILIDYKLRQTLDAKYADSTIQEFARSWQLWHYLRFYSEFLGRPVSRYAIVMVVLAPRAYIQLCGPFVVNPEALIAWERFARQRWADMDAEDKGTRIPAGQTMCKSIYGLCPYREACWEDLWDETLMTVNYVRRT